MRYQCTEYFKIIGANEEQWDKIKNNHKDEPTGEKLLCFSEPISIPDLKVRAKSLGVSVNDLFSGAVISGLSKLD